MIAKSETALVSAASGIGDILRITPLVRIFRKLGYDVDMLLWPDDPAVVGLVQEAPELRRVFLVPRHSKAAAAEAITNVRQMDYDVATFTVLSSPLSRWVDARRRYVFDAAWRNDGDSASLLRLARAIGWQGPLPAPFAMKSSRQFDLPKGTVALHPGCKPTWPWKKWHGFEDLAALFPNVVVIGTASDLDNSRTYFRRVFQWPDHVSDFVGKLDLQDTAALISQCAALISLDSGMMHLGVALRVPTFGIFGITSPARECMESPFMVPVTKGLGCEGDCRRRPWGRRDCEHHLACLKTLTAQEVAARIVAGV